MSNETSESTEELAAARSHAFVRFALPSIPLHDGDSCSKCRNKGGILVRRSINGGPWGRSGTHVRWQRVSCDECKWPKQLKREWPQLRRTGELIRATPESDANDSEQAKQSLKEDAIQKKECDTCGEEKSEDGFSVLVTLTCAHEQNTCLICLQAWIETQLDDGISNIGCTASGCQEKLEPADIQRQVSKESYHRYLELALKKSLSADTSFQYCMNPACKSGHYTSEDDQSFSCDVCGSTFCLKHDQPAAHGEESCHEYETRIQELKRKREADENNNELSLRAVKRIATECPGCGANIQKIDGCDHMTCSRCNYEFCYVCGADYERIRDQGNSEHRPSCPYHADEGDDRNGWW